jgi:hypothetical protein
MIDLASLATLFFEASKEWREPKVAVLDPPDEAEKEPVVKDLKVQGHKLQWAREDRLRQLKRDGWMPVVERDSIGRPTVFMDRLKELILVHRAKR